MNKILLSLTSAFVAITVFICRAESTTAPRQTQILKAVPVAKASPTPKPSPATAGRQSLTPAAKSSPIPTAKSSPAIVAKPTPVPTTTASPAASGTDLVSVRSLDPTIQVELRYATSRNFLGHPIYPPNMPALVRPTVAARLASAQAYLKARGFRLKIWDAYRPKRAHEQLWQTSPNSDYVANPADGMGSLHTWGVAVDATLLYENGHEVAMPTDFDVFTPAATLHYTGDKGAIGEHLHILQRAMAQAGFLGMRTEWWHFIAEDWKDYGPIDETKNIVPQLALPTNSPLPPIANTPAIRPRSVSR